MSGFKKAERKQVKLKLAITGPSGSGKTFSALRLAKGIGGRIALVDTEHKSASLYSDRFDFDVLEIEPPYTNEKYLAALATAEKEGYDVVIIDSLSHQWAGDGGLLNKKEQMDARGGNSYTNWAKMTPEHEKFKSAILHANLHVIGTLRSKQDYILETNDKGKQAPKKVGLAPIQREGMEYEFTVVFDVAMNHEAEVSKDRTSLFFGRLFQITEDTGKELAKWMTSGKAADPVAPPAAAAPAAPSAAGAQAPSRAHLLKQIAVPPNWPEGSLGNYMKLAYATSVPSELSKKEFDEMLVVVKNQTSLQALVALKRKVDGLPAETAPDAQRDMLGAMTRTAPPAAGMAEEPQPEWAEGGSHLAEPGSDG